MKISKEAKIGILAISTGIMLYFGFRFLKGTDFFATNNIYYATYANIDGLTKSNPVTINGLTVGRVKLVELMQNKNNQILVTVEVDKDIELGKNTEAVLMDNGLLGSKMIELRIKKSRNKMQEGDTLVASYESGLSALLADKTAPIIDKLNLTAVRINDLLGEFSGVGNKINGTLSNFEETSVVLKLIVNENRDNFSGLTTNLNTLSSSLVKTESQIRPLISKMDAFADSLNHLQLSKAIDNTNKTVLELNQIIKKINEGHGSLGALINNDSLYNNINGVSTNLQKLLIDLRLNPKRYIKLSAF